MRHRYCVEFVLSAQNTSSEILKNSIIEFGEGLEIAPLTAEGGTEGDFKIRIYTEDPTIIFDTCAQFGRIKSVRINEG